MDSQGQNSDIGNCFLTFYYGTEADGFVKDTVVF